MRRPIANVVAHARATGEIIDTPQTWGRQQRRSLAAGTVGNLVEWFDWSVYGFFAPWFAGAFFPPGDRFAAVLWVLTIFAVGFFFRPLGGAVLGSYADRHGRRASLTLTITIMAASSAVIALLPTYAQIGVAAPILLAVARCVQGFSAGGEFGASSSFLVENAPPGRRAWAGSWQQVSVGAGTLAASVLAALMFSVASDEFLTNWGWRIAFGVGALLGLLGLGLRWAVPDTDAFERVRAQGRIPQRPLTEVVREHPKAAVRVIGIVAAGTALVQFWFVSLPTVMNQHTGVELREAQTAAMLGLGLFTVLQPVSGWLSDRFGRRPLLLFFALGSAVLFVPLVNMIGTTMSSVLVPLAVSAVLLAAYAGSLAAVMAEQFPARVRTAGISLPYGVAVAVFGGLAPLVAAAASGVGVFWVFQAIMVGLCLISALVFWRMPETADV